RIGGRRYGSGAGRPSQATVAGRPVPPLRGRRRQLARACLPQRAARAPAGHGAAPAARAHPCHRHRRLSLARAPAAQLATGHAAAGWRARAGIARLDPAPGSRHRLPGPARAGRLAGYAMKITPLSIPDVLLIEPEVHADARGYFFESYNAARPPAALGRKLMLVTHN